VTSCRPRFDLLVRGELRKLSRQRANWVLIGFALLVALLAGLFISTSSGIWTTETQYRQTIVTDPGYWVHGLVVVAAMIMHIVGGVILLIASARLVGMEYTGPIRVILARGVGRLRLLAAKLVALAVFALLFTAVMVVLAVPYGLALAAAQGGSFTHALSTMPDSEWRDVEVHLLVVVISGFVCVLIGAAGAALGRSLALGLVIAIGFFPLDNFLSMHDGAVSDYQLGPALNVLNETLGHLRESIFTRPFDPPDSTHSLILIAVYAVVFLLVAIIPTRRRDVLE
jgi:ABC-type transport system involved in multi-copper enzyme maturation permease subunit